MAGIDPISNVASAADGIIGTIGGVLEHFIPDASKRAEAAAALEMEITKQQGEQNAGQIETNKVEAGSPNVFVSGWRPFIGWVCGSALAWVYLVGPMLAYLAHLCGSRIELPSLNTGDLMMLTVNMLGLGAMHSWDKSQGTAPPSATVITTKEVRKALPVG